MEQRPTDEQKVTALIAMAGGLGVIGLLPLSYLPEDLLVAIVFIGGLPLLGGLIYRAVLGEQFKVKHPQFWATLLRIFAWQENAFLATGKFLVVLAKILFRIACMAFLAATAWFLLHRFGWLPLIGMALLLGFLWRLSERIQSLEKQVATLTSNSGTKAISHDD